jgi:hypothetical protein
MDEATKAAFVDVSAALGTVNKVLGDIIGGMATKTEMDARFDAMMKRMNAGFERVLDSHQALRKDSNSTQEIIVTLGQRVTRLEEDMRKLRGDI